MANRFVQLSERAAYQTGPGESIKNLESYFNICLQADITGFLNYPDHGHHASEKKVSLSRR